MNLQELRNTFDKVVLKHHKDSANPRTVAAIVDGNFVFIGVAKCFETDQFNRRLGREIAVGRALRAHRRFSKDLDYRKCEVKREERGEPLSYFRMAGTYGTVEEILKERVFSEV